MSLDLGFDTVGNATLVAYDAGPVLATDPWLGGSAYFGSWRLTTAIPDEQRAQIDAAPFIWVSHGHPDHLHMESLQQLKGRTVLLADHVGGRIRDYLRSEGFTVEVMQDRVWRTISPRVKICSIADFNQDATLLVDIDGTLVVNANDASPRGGADFVRHACRRSQPTFLLALSGYGDADMINYFDENGDRIIPRAGKKTPPGPAIASRMESIGARYFVPFASHHCYQRADSVWANDYITPAPDHQRSFPAGTAREILPAFLRYDIAKDTATPLDPDAPPLVVHDPTAFGDDWAEPLTAADVDLARSYFSAITTLDGAVDEVVLDVGGEQHAIRTGSGSGRRVTFAAPRNSLTEAMRWEFFDDLLIGNFMRTSLHGDWPNGLLNPTFTAPVTKYADNGRAKTPAELKAYFAAYRRRAPLSYLRFRLAERRTTTIRAVARRTRASVHEGSLAHRLGKSAYARVRRVT